MYGSSQVMECASYSLTMNTNTAQELELCPSRRRHLLFSSVLLQNAVSFVLPNLNSETGMKAIGASRVKPSRALIFLE
jgi:hypothetical protein